MAFPTTPTDGQISTVNNIRYVYNAATSSWTRLLGTKYIASASSPSNPNLGDLWYDTNTDALYEFINDGTTSYWVDMSSEGAGNISLVGDSTLQGNLAPGVDSVYRIGSPTGYLKNIYANTVVANIANVGTLVTTTGLFWANGSSLAGSTYDNASVAAYLPTFTGTLAPSLITNSGNLTVAGNIVQQRAYYETYGNLTNVGGNLTCNFNNGTIFNVTAITANVTANFTNVNAISNSATGAVIILTQGATAYNIANVQVNGVNTYVRWVSGNGSGISPMGLASNTDIISFSIMHLGSGNYTVFGQLSSFA